MKKNKFSKVTQSFSRYEFKYILSKNKADKIENEIKHFMVLDKNAIKKTNKKYFVRSLYFDNSINSNFYEKVDGMQIRKKFRIRSYSNYKNSKNPIFLEMKGRRNQRTYKIRTLIKPNNINLLLDISSDLLFVLLVLPARASIFKLLLFIFNIFSGEAPRYFPLSS